MTLDEYLGKMCADTLIHTWDVARAARVDDMLDPGAVAVVLAGFLVGDGPVRAPGRYAEAVEADGVTTEQDRLIAFTGRDPRW